MKRIYFIILLLVPLCIFAQKDTKARQILDRTASALQQAGGIRATFEGSNNGTLLMKGEKFFLDCAGISSWFDGKTQWSYVSDNEEVTISIPTPEELQGINPYALIQSYKNGYNYQYKGKHTQNGIIGHEVKLIPEHEQSLKSITLFVTEKYLPIYIKVEQDNGMADEIIITSCQTNQKLNDNVFVFDKKKYPNAEIIDMR
ncbi:MAG: outer-membrane lipoprotein carrier protein LolA [Bacteroidaceae bacterium]|nr:outer-membrane lipoprotein carrier protein LolA [Bacteroidaceae bacterium]